MAFDVRSSVLATEIHLRGAETTRENIRRFEAELPEKRGLLPHNYKHYLRSISAYALRTTGGAAEYGAVLAKFDGAAYFSKYLELHRSGEHTPSFSHVTVDMIDLIAIPLLLGRHDLGRSYVRGALATADTSSVLAAYLRGLVALVEKRNSDGELPQKLRGMENHWGLYVRLMAALSRGEEPGAVRTLVQQSFLRCNSDRRLMNVSHIDPTGSDPVSWDVRNAYVEALISSEPNNSSNADAQNARAG